MTLARFLLARYDEDEAKLRAAAYVDKPSFGRVFDVVSDCDCGEDHGYSNYLAVDPDRLLAEVEAKRRAVKWCSERERIHVPTYASDPDNPRPDEFIPGRMAHPADAVVLRFLALPYADHPDYREEWRA
jgi:hypothetical protein